jgi:hypothetical protein
MTVLFGLFGQQVSTYMGPFLAPLFAKAGFPFLSAPSDSRQAGMTGLAHCAAFFPAVILASAARPESSGRH